MNPTVSVVIPTYNTAKYISEAIESVLAQTYKDFEIIVVDDGSTDNTKEVLQPCIEQIRYIYQGNGGRASARNTGIKAARGRYVAFLDSDDMWTPGKLEKQVDIMEGNENIDFLFGDKQRFSDDGTTIISSMFKKHHYDETFFGDPLYVRDAHKKLLETSFIPTGTVIMRKECFDKSGLFDETIYTEDYEFWLRIALFNNLAYSTQLWELERDREGSGSKNLKAVYLSNIKILEKHEREFSETLVKLDIDINDIICNVCFNKGYFFLSHENSLARECFKKSLSRKFKIKTSFYYLLTFFGEQWLKAVKRLRDKKCRLT